MCLLSGCRLSVTVSWNSSRSQFNSWIILLSAASFDSEKQIKAANGNWWFVGKRSRVTRCVIVYLTLKSTPLLNRTGLECFLCCCPVRSTLSWIFHFWGLEASGTITCKYLKLRQAVVLSCCCNYEARTGDISHCLDQRVFAGRVELVFTTRLRLCTSSRNAPSRCRSVHMCLFSD